MSGIRLCFQRQSVAAPPHGAVPSPDPFGWAMGMRHAEVLAAERDREAATAFGKGRLAHLVSEEDFVASPAILLPSENVMQILGPVRGWPRGRLGGASIRGRSGAPDRAGR
ncbi:hypothetical protein [Paractinoplanes atraurantiacus]|uniref:Uncharacterized protein n=1 Tax=Paractinoplanes atraurantiacus TaxID=1036182 RepID=A0A285GIJ4_9ACTN|nr:hypothetical protein [Actinoplanes atraurantiacus]SNY23407.1 hypothetical protein SAMN05421748_10236 [Actinoplanes atraurantiacus]